MHRCKREAVDLEKMQSLEEKLEEEEEKLKKKKKLDKFVAENVKKAAIVTAEGRQDSIID